MKIVACYSIKGGVGKTSSAVNLAYAFAQRGRSTLLVDLDAQAAATYTLRVQPSRQLKARTFLTKRKALIASIRGSNYHGLDLLPANLSFRHFDPLLKGLKRSRSRLGRVLGTLDDDYDLAVLDCPPNITLLSENVLAAADAILVPVIPTTLSERTYEKLLQFCADHEVPLRRIHAFFAMVQKRNRLHRDTISRLRLLDQRFLATEIPQSVDVERMGVHQEPVLVSAPHRPASQAYRELADEVLALLGSD